MATKTKGTGSKEIVKFCLSLPGAYEDYPFHDDTLAMRHYGNKKIFALFIEYNRQHLLNLKCDPFKSTFLRNSFKSVIPGYHMNKEHWNTVILDGSVPLALIETMVVDSHELTRPKIKRRKKEEF